jgi:hypothetical protein
MPNPWNKNRSRKFTETRETRKVLVLCEDEKTAPNYFKKFPFNPEDVLIEVVGTGINTDSLVREAIQRKENAASSGKKYIRVWCVFDRDSFPAQNFNEAFNLAKAHGINIAYANQCFELWYWLHFDFQQTAVSRDEYGTRLSDRLGRKYQKSDTTLYDELKTRQADAIRNSKRLLSFFKPCNPERDDPSTTVHTLVEFLNDFKPYQAP